MGPHYLGELASPTAQETLVAFRTVTKREPIDGDLVFWTDGNVTTQVVWSESNSEFISAGGSLPGAIISLFIPMTGVVDTAFEVYGEYRELAADQTGDYSTASGVGNQHIAIVVNSITTGGDVVISGVSLGSEGSGVPVAADTETLVVDDTAGQIYQTTKKWYELTGVDVSDTTDLDYDIYYVGYLDMGNRNFELVGYRCEARSAGNASDYALRFRKVKDDGDGKMSFEIIEHLGIDSTAGGGELVDSIRTGDADRSVTFTANAWPSDNMFVFKQLDFNTIFTAGENIFEGGDKNEGLIIDFLGEPEGGGISQVDFVTLTLFGVFM